jgi:hypothetical protein
VTIAVQSARLGLSEGAKMRAQPEIRERILNAAQQLFEASGRLELPTVDAVRRLSKTNIGPPHETEFYVRLQKTNAMFSIGYPDMGHSFWSIKERRIRYFYLADYEGHT